MSAGKPKAIWGGGRVAGEEGKGGGLEEKRQNLSTALHGTAAKEQIHTEIILCFVAF